ncbi:MAG: Flp pilus assembly complex ATPase component TadA [Candidatus Wildermuthbacteria bacterium]|nr:Flp pilus assembly complex ATPase component TadA [Candidatus Wildermuthbacteria bacterium]
MNILEILAKKNLIEENKVQDLVSQAQSSGITLEELVLSLKLIDEDTLFSAKSEALNIPLKKVDPGAVSLKVLNLIPEDSAKYYKMVPFSQQDRVLEIGMVYPEDPQAKEALSFLSRQGNFAFQVFLISISQFEALMKQYRQLKGEMTQALQELEKEIVQEPAQAGKGAMRRITEEAPVTKVVAVILRTAVEGGASDIHIEPTRENVRVRFRLLGELHSSLILPLRIHQAIIARIKILSSMRIDENRLPQDGRFSTMVDEKQIDFRVSTFPTALGEKVALRVLDPSKGLKTFEDLGLQEHNLFKLKEACAKPYGLILSTGPTGSGKTTTLYAILHELNKEGVNIVSLEDPVEYMMPGVNQSQVKPEIGYDFASGLRQILRQDPNIILVGEVRDKETASLVIHAALTGHIVLSTLHTNNALGVVPRLIDMGIDKYLIPTTLVLVLSQRLVRRLCDLCKEKINPAEETVSLIEKEMNQLPPNVHKIVLPLLKQKDTVIFKAKGCRQCGSSGFSGRIGIFEVLSMTESLGKLILQDPSESAIAKEAKLQGMTTMRQDGIMKVLDGITTIEEVLRATEEYD